MKTRHEEAQEADKALHELWKALGIEPAIRWVLDGLTSILNYLSNGGQMKKLWYRIKCLFGYHVWRDRRRTYNCLYRSCIHCGKYQYKGVSQIRKMEWKDV